MSDNQIERATKELNAVLVDAFRDMLRVGVEMRAEPAQAQRTARAGN